MPTRSLSRALFSMYIKLGPYSSFAVSNTLLIYGNMDMIISYKATTLLPNIPGSGLDDAGGWRRASLLLELYTPTDR